MDYNASPIYAYAAYTCAEYQEFHLFAMYRRKAYRKLDLAAIIVQTALLALNLPLSILWFFHGRTASGLLLELLLAAIFCTYLFYRSWLPKRRYRQSGKLFGGGVSYTFFAQEFEMERAGSVLIKDKSRMHYSVLNRVYETSGMFYLYLTRSQALLVSKARMREDAQRELATLLLSWLGPEKYKRCY